MGLGICPFLENNPKGDGGEKTPLELFDIAMVFLLALSFLNPIGYVFEVTIAVFLIVPLWVSFHIRTKRSEENG